MSFSFLRLSFQQFFQFTVRSTMEHFSGADNPDNPNKPERPLEPRQDCNGSDEKKPGKSWQFWVSFLAGKMQFRRPKPGG
jgi:hypothetical protein